MIQAGESFNHIVQHRHNEEHVLVKTGMYSVLRHPSYFGFFWWALGTQLVLGNVLCFFAYFVVLWRFFSVRIRHEEASLVKHFGDQYVHYRKAVGTKIPLYPEGGLFTGVGTTTFLLWHQEDLHIRNT